MTSTLVVTTTDPAGTWQLGQALGRAARGGECIALDGALGAGKTLLTKGIAAGLGVTDPRAVNSPTYVLVNEYHGRLCLQHIDAYRLTDAGALDELGFDELRGPGTLVVVEWASRVADRLVDALWIQLTVPAETVRCCTISSPGPALDHLVAACGPRSDGELHDPR